MTNVQVVTAAPPLAEKETTIHDQRGAGDEGGIIRTQEDHRVGDFVGGTKRSEERRVGKECRSRGATEHGKKNKSVSLNRREGRGDVHIRTAERAGDMDAVRKE